MSGDCFGINWGELAALYLLGLLFGIGFNLFTAWCDRKGYINGYTALFVVAGVIVTLALTAVINLAFALITAGAFASTGTPMILGSIWRHMVQRERMIEQLRKEVQDDDSA